LFFTPENEFEKQLFSILGSLYTFWLFRLYELVQVQSCRQPASESVDEFYLLFCLRWSSGTPVVSAILVLPFLHGCKSASLWADHTPRCIVDVGTRSPHDACRFSRACRSGWSGVHDVKHAMSRRLRYRQGGSKKLHESSQGCEPMYASESIVSMV